MGTPGRRTLLEFSRLGQLHKCPENVASEVPFAANCHSLAYIQTWQYGTEAVLSGMSLLSSISWRYFSTSTLYSHFTICTLDDRDWDCKTATDLCSRQRYQQGMHIWDHAGQLFPKLHSTGMIEVLWGIVETYWVCRGHGKYGSQTKKRFISIKKKCLTNLYVAEDMQ